jgi:hypothetical protein
MTSEINHSTVDPPQTLNGGVGKGTVETASGRGGSVAGFINDEPLPDGTNLWDVCISRQAQLHSPIELLLEELKYEGGLGGARLKVLAELQAILRSTPVGVDADEAVQVPAWHLTILTRWAMERLG